jgi:hypothetical protein
VVSFYDNGFEFGIDYEWMELKGIFSYFSFHNWFFFNTIITNCIIICEIWNKYDYLFMWWHYLSQIKVVISCSKCGFWEVKVQWAFLWYNYIHVNYITHNRIGHTWLHSQSRHTIFYYSFRDYVNVVKLHQKLQFLILCLLQDSNNSTMVLEPNERSIHQIVI